tara:strand:+ start:265 stop:1344 length:1080 start_codon:yes stop_codon:yes gene_type:complete
MELTIRPDISWTEKIKDFLKEWHKFEHIICDKKLFEWFFLINQNNPTLKNDKLRFILAHENGKIYSLLSFYECNFLIKGTIKKGAWGSGWYTLRTNQNMFLGGLLRKAYLNEFEVAGNIGCSDTTISIARYMGSNIINKINPLVLKKESFGKIENLSFDILNENKNYFFETFSEKTSRAIYKRSSEFDKKSINSIKTLLTEEYFNWRYRSHPYFDYMITKIKFNNQSFDNGALIWRLVTLDNGEKLCRIVNCDVPNLQNYEFIVLHLVKELINELQQVSINYIDCFTTDIEMIRTLKKLGWIYDINNLYPNRIDPVEKGNDLNGEFFIKGETDYKNLNFQFYNGDGDADRPNRKSSLLK